MSIFDEVKEHLNMRQVVEFYGFKVNRAGQFVCPFHNDKHPSASIKKDFFNCFVCGAGGDVISFVGKLYGLRNIDACKKLIQDFNLPIDTEQKKLTSIDRLIADRERQKRLKKIQDEKKMEAIIHHAGNVLADFHRFLWIGKQQYTYGDKRHDKALQELTQAEYYLECYDDNPKEFATKERKLVARIEKDISVWNNQG